MDRLFVKSLFLLPFLFTVMGHSLVREGEKANEWGTLTGRCAKRHFGIFSLELGIFSLEHGFN